MPATSRTAVAPGCGKPGPDAAAKDYGETMLQRSMRKLALSLAILSFGTGLGFAAGLGQAKAASACRTIRLGYGGWLDNRIQNAVFAAAARPLGYDVVMRSSSLGRIYHRLADGRLDAYLQNWKPDNWMSSGNRMRDSYIGRGKLDVLGVDLAGARHTLAVPAYLYRAGLRDFADIHKFAKQLHHTIYGVESDNLGDRRILSMIAHDRYGLGGFHLVQAGPGRMLQALARKYARHEPVLVLGWQPAPMNVQYRIRYLAGGGAGFAHQGRARSLVLARHGYAAQCPAAAGLLRDFRLPVRAESRIMYDVRIRHETAAAVAARWVKTHPAWLRRMRDGVGPRDGHAEGGSS